MSLPPTVRWEYNFQPKENSLESELVSILKIRITNLQTSEESLIKNDN